MALFSDSILIIGALAIFVERSMETFINAVMPDRKSEEPDWPEWRKHLKRVIMVVAVAGLGLAISFGLELRLMSQILPNAGLDPTQDKIITGFLIGGGSAPAHEILRYIEGKKKKAAEEAEEKRLDVSGKKEATA